jgi:hypothetical protein
MACSRACLMRRAEVPEGVGRIAERLRVLVLTDNRIAVVPEAVLGALVNLRRLSVSKNRLGTMMLPRLVPMLLKKLLMRCD